MILYYSLFGGKVLRYGRMNTKAESSDYKNLFTSLIWGLLAGAIVCTAFLFAFAFVFVKMKSVPFSMINTLAIICESLGAFVSGYIAVKIHKKNGLIYGAAAGISLFLILTIVGFVVSRDKFTYITLIKFLFLTLMGAVGGVLSVNKRSR